ncbi:MAG TPA: AAA family ATPase [Bacteroidales bacterium]|nr:AAA family ATPase [Bacteroidales bacterium]
MIQTIQEILLDAQEREWFQGTARHLKVRVVPRKATVLIGVRRCGKSTLMHQISKELQSGGVSRENILYLNFFDDRLSGLKTAGADTIMEAYFRLYPGKRGVEKIYCFFDEVQVIPGWEAFVDRILETENCEVYLTGSSAQMLSREIATQMRGRALSWELFPFSFGEYLDFAGISSRATYGTGSRYQIQKGFEAYWETGGFPEVMGMDPFLRIKIHQEYLSSILFRDLIERYDIPHPRAVADLAHRLIGSAGSLYTLNGLTNYLKSIGHKVPKSSVADYLAWFEDAYFLFTVRIFDASYGKSNANPKKIYGVDHAFIRSIAPGILVNSGHMLENLVFIALRRGSDKIYYYRTRNGQEIDFLIIGNNGLKSLYQVTESLENPATRAREVKSLNAAMKELDLNSATIVTRNGEEVISTDVGEIEVIEAWRFLLRQDFPEME